MPRHQRPKPRGWPEWLWTQARKHAEAPPDPKVLARRTATADAAKDGATGSLEAKAADQWVDRELARVGRQDERVNTVAATLRQARETNHFGVRIGRALGKTAEGH